MTERHASHPPVRRQLGQHFLNDPRILARIADAARLTGNETVVEIGAGRGSLTAALQERAGRVVAIELDRALATLLRERFGNNARVSILQADVLDVALGEVAGGPFTLVGNVPYYITTPILFRALEPPQPRCAVFLVQREVAERMTALPGTRTYGALSVNLQALATTELLFPVRAAAFQPPPAVDSAVVRVTPRMETVIAPSDAARYRRLVQDSFALRRKQMRRVARTIFGLDAATADVLLHASGIAPLARPETLTPGQFAALLHAAPHGPGKEA
ncbi:MAG TPA: 16S rRNA (adenine(1518)-N(6)/adenine(1519)-N(6))-dimethyltransferase RsmA [Gemmatimonadaceae bacterium]|nr:16S rRNA (adenine(1518)-N(6)/adenine(1519)-N(6))-dimethyltransferase RsmA [Gemmatimonadaceae bacterium]